MRPTLFVSDVHLSPQRPDITEQFERFLIDQAPAAGALYLLGDLFERWIGDDAAGSFEQRIAGALRRLADAGTRICFLHGNRDFLLGAAYAQQAGMELMSQPTRIDLAGRRVLICHGDQLCTLDLRFQRYRRRVLDPEWQRRMLARPLWLRRSLAVMLRSISRWRNRRSTPARMDVSQQAVEALLRAHDAELLIHGHTHRPGRHRFDCDGRVRERIVLGDWYAQGSVLVADGDRLEFQSLARAG